MNEFLLQTEDIFTEFDTEALGAASLAQVYKAKLRTGETVAVKVQHADVKAHSYVDIKTMEVLVRTAAWVFPDFKLLWLLEETKKNLPTELDFLHEGRNADQLRNLMTHCTWLRVRAYYAVYD
jgi:aarF domain-containing kinase